MRLAAKTNLYLITDRRLLGDGPAALDRVVKLAADASAAGVDLVQIHERDLDAGTLVDLARRIRERVAGTATRILVSDRFDIALAAGIDGVHLATHSLDASVVRRAAGSGLLIGASTHSAAELAAAEHCGANFAVCGPVFDTPSKHAFGKPLGPDAVATLAAGTTIPVYALGGVTIANAHVAAQAPIAGLAAIGMFHRAWLRGGLDGLRSLVTDLHAAI